MSASKGSVVVSRSYEAAPDECVRALRLLLNKPVSKEGGCGTAPNDEKVRSSNDSLATQNYTR
jgi:hypothetical protein